MDFEEKGMVFDKAILWLRFWNSFLERNRWGLCGGN